MAASTTKKSHVNKKPDSTKAKRGLNLGPEEFENLHQQAESDSLISQLIVVVSYHSK